MSHLVAVLALALLAAGCSRPSQQDCEALCWKYSELQYWAAFDEQARDLSDEDRATLRAEREAEWEQLRKEPQNRGRDNCISACRKGGSKAQVACVDKATTAAEAAACLKDG
jgi:hypothetical protein